MTLYATNIQWETDGEEVELPKKVKLPFLYMKEQDISDYLSDTYGWLHNGFEIIRK